MPAHQLCSAWQSTAEHVESAPFSWAHVGQGFPLLRTWFETRCCLHFYPWRSTAITLPNRPRTDSLARVSVQLMGSCVSPQGSACSRFPSYEHPDAVIPQNILFLEKCKHFHSKGRHQKAEERYCCTRKPHPYFSILKPSGQLTAQQKRQRAGQAAPRHQRVLRHRCAEKWIYCTASCSLPNAKWRWEESPF